MKCRKLLYLYCVISCRKTLDESEWSSCAKSGEISFLQSQIAQEQQQQDGSGGEAFSAGPAGNGNEAEQSVAGLSVQVMPEYHLQDSAKMLLPRFVICGPALAYHFCLNFRKFSRDLYNLIRINMYI